MSLTTRQNELLTEIEMDDREDSVDLSLQQTQSQLKVCYWSNLNREQKGKKQNANEPKYFIITKCLNFTYTHNIKQTMI